MQRNSHSQFALNMGESHIYTFDLVVFQETIRAAFFSGSRDKILSFLLNSITGLERLKSSTFQATDPILL